MSHTSFVMPPTCLTYLGETLSYKADAECWLDTPHTCAHIFQAASFCNSKLAHTSHALRARNGLKGLTDDKRRVISCHANISQDAITSPAGFEVNKFEYLSEDFPYVGHVQQHERHAQDGVQDSGNLPPLSAWRKVAIPCAEQKRIT